ncbi:MAG TPA: glycosyltransferase [Elusimicrobiota bacterium]|nr:glycosyltransferase [Elusimicrobiota bacterium]
MPRRSTLFHVDGERGFRGGERQLLYLAAALRARGRRNVVYCRAGAELDAEARRQGFETRALPFWSEWDPVSAWRLAADARREGAVIHAHTGHAAGIASLAALGGAPLVAHRRVDFGVGTAARALKYGRAGKTVAVSSAIARILREAGLPEERISVIPDGLPATAEESAWTQGAARFRPPLPVEKTENRRLLAVELGVDASMTWVGNLAALVPHKDHDTLLAAAVIVLLKRPRTRFLIAGTGPEEARLVDRVNRMGLFGKVLFLGQRKDPLLLLQSLDVYVQSSWGEGMGSVLIEAAACGLPVAATAAGGIPDVVEDGRTGLLAPPRSPEALAEAILQLCDDRALAKRLADEGLKRLPRFGLARMAADMEKIYDSLD